MRRVLFIILLLSSFGTTAQVFNFKVDWFDNNSFFEAVFLQSKKVESISISVSEKKDGAYFQGARPILRYDFNANGQLKRSYKLIPLKNKIDTALFQFFYTDKNQLYKRTEQQGLFNFGYYFFYKNGFLEREVKINQTSKDTAYLRYFESTIQGLERSVILLNSIHKPFATISEKKSKSGLLLRKKLAYNRNPNYSEVSYSYKGKQLIQKKEQKLQGKELINTYFLHKGDKLDLVKIEKNNILIKKYAFTYTESGLPKEIIERDMIKKNVKIYKIDYTYLKP